MTRFGVRSMVQVGVLAALVCAASWLRFDIPSPVGNTAIHMGNVMCILSGLLLGPVPGGLAAGIGSGLFDLLNPKYITSAPFTLVFKFFIGFFAGRLAFSAGRQGEDVKRNAIGGAVGSLVYIVLYLTRTYLTARYVTQMPVGPAFALLLPKVGYSLINAAIAVVAATVLAPVIRTALDRAGIALNRKK